MLECGPEGLPRADQETFIRALCPELPDHLVSKISVPMPDSGIVDHKGIPWNRRARRSMRLAKPGSVVLQVFSGSGKVGSHGRVLEVERQRKGELRLDTVYQQLLLWAQSGVIGGIVGSSPSDFKDTSQGELKERDGPNRWGELEQQGSLRQVCDETVVWFRVMFLHAVAQAAGDMKENIKAGSWVLPREGDHDDLHEPMPQGGHLVRLLGGPCEKRQHAWRSGLGGRGLRVQGCFAGVGPYFLLWLVLGVCLMGLDIPGLAGFRNG